jgi:hypothetical protein
MTAAIGLGGLTYGALLFLLSRPDSLERRLLNLALERWRR